MGLGCHVTVIGFFGKECGVIERNGWVDGGKLRLKLIKDIGALWTRGNVWFFFSQDCTTHNESNITLRLQPTFITMPQCRGIQMWLL